MSIRKVFLPIRGEMIGFYQVSTRGIKRYGFGGKNKKLCRLCEIVINRWK